MSIVGTYVDLTEAIVSATGNSHALAHVHAGLAIYVAVQLLVRERRAAVHALIAVAGAALANEVLEAGFYQSFRWHDTLGDVALTLLWPTILCTVARFRRRRWANRQRCSYPTLRARAHGMN